MSAGDAVSDRGKQAEHDQDVHGLLLSIGHGATGGMSTRPMNWPSARRWTRRRVGHSPSRCRCWFGRTPDEENAGTTTGSPSMGLSQRQQISGPYAPLTGHRLAGRGRRSCRGSRAPGLRSQRACLRGSSRTDGRTRLCARTSAAGPRLVFGWSSGARLLVVTAGARESHSSVDQPRPEIPGRTWREDDTAHRTVPAAQLAVRLDRRQRAGTCVLAHARSSVVDLR